MEYILHLIFTNILRQRLRNIVHNLKHIPNNAEHTVTNCVNDMTHTDEMTAQH